MRAEVYKEAPIPEAMVNKRLQDCVHRKGINVYEA